MASTGVFGAIETLLPNIYTFTVDNITQLAIKTKTNCTKIVLYENDQAGTSDYLVRAPTATSPQATKPAGQKWEIPMGFAPGRYYPAGTIVGYIVLVSGSVTWVQEEYP